MTALPEIKPIAPPPEPTLLEQRWPVLAVTLALHLIAAFLIAFVAEAGDRADDYRIGVILGTLFGQIALVAVWTAWAPASFFRRLAGGMALIGLVSLTVAGLILRNSSGAGGETVVLFGVIFFAQWIVAQTPLWLVRAAWGQRIAAPDEVDAGSPGREMQFGVGQLLTLTACVAVLLGLARGFFSPEVVQDWRSDWAHHLALVVLFAAFNTLAPLPTMWAAFARSAGLWLLLAAMYLVAVTAAEALAFVAAIGQGNDDVSIFAWINATMYFIIAGTLLAFRYCGFRLRDAR